MSDVLSLLPSSSKSQLLQCVPLLTLILLVVPQTKTQCCAILSPSGADTSVLLLCAAFVLYQDGESLGCS